MRLYHGTRHANIESLRPSTGGEFGPGIYLTASLDTANWYAHHVSRGSGEPIVLVVEAAIHRPFRVRKVDWIKLTTRSTPGSVVKRLKKAGYDGIIGVAINDYEEQVVAWEPEQVEIESTKLAGTTSSRSKSGA